MQDFAQKNKFRKLLYSPLSIIALVVIALLFGKGTYSMFQKYKESKISRDALQNEINEITKRQQYLDTEIKVLSSSSGLEKKLRANFDIKKEGEEVAVIVNQNKEGETEEITAKEASSWVQKLIVSIVDFLQ